MKLTTPYAVLAGFALVALAIASQPLTGSMIPDAWAQSDWPIRVTICHPYGVDSTTCAFVGDTANSIPPSLWVQAK